MVQHPDLVGQQFGSYKLLRLLGAGGFAEVYLGEHIDLGTQAAIKVLHTKLSPTDINAFRTEARTIAGLVHPHIVRVLDFNAAGSTPFLVMDYAAGGTTRQRYSKGTIVPLPTIVSYVQQVAEALQYAHDEKLIHRDIKPENILLDKHDNALLSDFGIALVVQSSRYQSTQEIIGTAPYMSPEQIQGHPRPASDQYSLAIVVYEWLSGTRPFEGILTELWSQHIFASPPPLCKKVPTISREVEHVVMTALAKDPKQRFGNVRAFATALQQASQAGQAILSPQFEPQPEMVTGTSGVETVDPNPSLQPNEMSASAPVTPLSQQEVREVSADRPAQSHTPLPLSGREHLSQAEEERHQAEGKGVRQEQEQADKLEEERERSAKETVLVPTGGATATHKTALPHPGQNKRRRASAITIALILLVLILLGIGFSIYYSVTETPPKNLSSVAWSGSQFVAVGASGTILTSPDGHSWTTRTSGISSTLLGVTWSDSQFVAVGASGTILTSPNGRSWTTQYADTTSNLHGVAWSGSQFVAVGASGTILTSPDGHSWTTQTSDTPQDLQGVVWAGSQFVVVDWTILTSPDGRSWDIQYTSPSPFLFDPLSTFLGVAWSGSQFVVVGDSGQIFTSPDANTWTTQNVGTMSNLLSVAWSGSQFVAVGDSGTILTSPDGRSWTIRTSSTSNSLHGVVWSGSQFVAVGDSGTVLTSPDGRFWTT